jgi:hypothetical protein
MPASPGGGGLAYGAPGGSGLSDLFSDVINHKAIQEQGAENRAETQAKTATADATTAQANDALLQRLTNAGAANPQIAQSPLWQAAVGARLKSLGVGQLPTGADGNVDMNALRTMSSPRKPFTEYSPTELKQLQGVPPDVRSALVPDAPPDFLSAKVQVPMTAVGESQLYTHVENALAQVGAGKLPPGQLLAQIQSAKARLTDAGMSTAAVDAYLTPDGQNLSSSIVEQLSGDYAQAQMRKIDSLGIVAMDRLGLQQSFQDEHAREFNVTDARKTTEFGQTFGLAQERERRLTAAQITNAANAATRLQQGWERLTVAQQQANTAAGGLALRQANAQIAPLMKVYTDALNQRNANVRAIQNAINQHMANPSDPNAVKKAVDPGLVDATTGLDALLTQIGPQLSALQQQAGKQPAVDYTTATGHPAKVQTAPPKAGADVPGLPGWKFTGKTDGQGRPLATDGKTQRPLQGP